MTEEKEKLLIANLWALGLMVALFPLTTLLMTVVLLHLWMWFVQPTFDLVVPGFFTMYGLTLLYFPFQRLTSKSVEEESQQAPVRAVIRSATYRVVFYLLIWGVGAITHVLAT